MKTSRLLLILSSILSFDLSLFQAVNALRSKWSAAFNAPPELLADRELLLAAGLFISLLAGICGTYALSGAGVIPRLPLLRLGLFGIGGGYVILGTSVLPRLLLADPLPAASSIPLPLVSTLLVVPMTGLFCLAGLAFGWKYLSPRGRGAPRRGARPAAATLGQIQNQGPSQG